MTDLLIHPQTLKALEQAITSSAHAFLLTGPDGAGKTTLARQVIQQKLATSTELVNYPYYLEVSPEKGSISIDTIRELQKFLQLKTAGGQPWRRAVLINDAHTMTIEAQNALLKSLEEPPEDTLMVLTAPGTLYLKPTIYSRVQQLEVMPVSEEQARNYFKADETTFKRAYALSEGYTGLLAALLTSDEDHELFQAVTEAKSILSKDVFGRLAEVESLAKKKDTLNLFLQSCRLVCSAALKNALTKNEQKTSEHLLHSLKVIYAAEAALNYNPNSKLLLTNLMLNL